MRLVITFVVALLLGIIGIGTYFYIDSLKVTGEPLDLPFDLPFDIPFLENASTVTTPQETTQDSMTTTPITNISKKAIIDVQPIKHASLVIGWEDDTIHVDPVGPITLYSGKKSPDLVLLTHTHSDHLDPKLLASIITDDTVIIAPQSVADALPIQLSSRVQVLANNETTSYHSLTIEAVPMYNIPESEDSYHQKGEGNGYIIQEGDDRVYIAGDTSVTPEMRALENIRIAFIPMNLPYTMDINEAAEGVLAFAPQEVYPYHFRGTDGFSDIAAFVELIESQNHAIQVTVADWYPAEQ